MEDLFIQASRVEDEPTNWMWENRIPYGAITVIDGNPGVNKSTMLCELGARLSTGRNMPNSDSPTEPGSVIFLVAEDSPSRIRAMLETNEANLDRAWIVKPDENAPLVFPKDAGLLEEKINQLEAKMVVIDPVDSFIEGSLNNFQQVRASLGPLLKVAERTQSAIIIVRHQTKSASNNALYRGIGSIAIIALARSGLLVAPEPGNPERRVIAGIKNNLGPIAPTLSFGFSQLATGQQVNWGGPCDLTADQILSASNRDSPALLEACHVLYSILGDGPVWVNEATKLAKSAGISGRTLRRAKELLGVQSKRQGFGKDSRFYWRISPKSDLIQNLRDMDLDELADALFYGPTETPGDFNGQPTDSHQSDIFRDSFNSQPNVDLETDDDDDDDKDDPAEWWKRSGE